MHSAGTTIMEKVAATLLLLLYLASAQQEQCGSIGNSDETAVTASRAQMFYLDTANPAPCTGNITSWRVCYYGPDSVNNRGSYWATYAVYRRMGSGSSVRYMRVSEMFGAIRTIEDFVSADPIVDGEIVQGGFNCYDDYINVGDSPLTIQAGDILGACVFNPDGDIPFVVIRLPLDVVGEASGDSLLQMGTTGCSRANIPSDISPNQLSTVNSRRLHIYANIEREPITTQTPSAPAITTTAATTTTAAQTIAITINPTTEALPTTTTADTITTTLVSQTFGPTQSSSVTTIPSPVTTSQPASNTEDVTASIPNISRNGTPIGPIVGAIIGVLLVMILGVAIAVVILYLVRRRNTGAKYSTGRRASEKKVYGIDNVTYTAGYIMAGGTTVNGESRVTLEAGAYEVPLSSMQSAVCGNKREDRKYESLEATYALPHEYATVGPNEAKPSNHYEGNYSPLDEVTTSYAQLLDKNKQEDIYGDVQEYLQPAMKESEIYAQLRACGIINISSNLIQIKGRIGSGQFGFVEQGVWRNGARDIVVAVKLLKKGADEIDKVKFLQEAAIMAQFKHPNVVSLYGVVSKTEPLMLVVELIEKGDLRNYLHTMRPDPGELPASNMPRLLLGFCQQVALGMHYLSAKGFVHRDLAARNILVSKDNICKVSDFGMSRDLADETYYVSQGGKIPVKWTAPEAIHYKKFSSNSDIWSYGCLLYEIWSLGYKPFEGVGNAEVIELVDSGQRLPPPSGCSRVIYELMIKCWNPVAGLRPSFRELLLSLLSSPKVVLSIPQEALNTHNLAGVLGSPLEAGVNMYRDLQNKYYDNADYQELA